MEKIQIPLNEYNSLKEELELLKDTVLISKINKLLDLMYKEKYGLYMGNYTDDLEEISIDNNYNKGSSVWDNL
jgi:hypothetical protein